MIVKEKLGEEYVTLAEVKEELNQQAEQRADDDREMAYELRTAIDHANEFAVLETDEAKDLLDELEGLEKVDSFVAHKIVDLLPEDRDQLRAVYAKERYSVSSDELDEILNIVAKYR